MYSAADLIIEGITPLDGLCLVRCNVIPLYCTCMTDMGVKGMPLFIYNNFIGHCGGFCRLKWIIQRSKIIF